MQQEVDRVLKTHPDGRDRAAVADMLFRLGEIEASHADAHAQWQNQTAPFVLAYAVYWVADGVRAGNAVDDHSVRWQKVSARSVRYYIRVTLKLARILTTGSQPGSCAHACALAYYLHARRMMDVYTRHLFRLPRERLAMLLLMAAATRVWAEIVGDVDAAGSDVIHLQASLAYLRQAEALLIELGLTDAIAFRFYLERIKTQKRLAQSASPDAAFFLQQARRDIKTLRRLSDGNAFWSPLASRQKVA